LAQSQQWRRVAILAAALAAMAAGVLLAPLVGYAWHDKQARDSERPHPKLASTQDWRAILEAVMASRIIQGVPPPPPETAAEAKAREEAPPPPLVLVTSTLELCEPDDPFIAPGPLCKGEEQPLQSGITAVYVDPRIPLKLRRELVVANPDSVTIPDVASWPWPLVEHKALRAFLDQGGWDAFYREFPESAGFMQVTHPVLSENGNQAVIFVEASCGGVCGSGEVLLLERTGDGWKVLFNYRLWIS
jgi:hypothetical protein